MTTESVSAPGSPAAAPVAPAAAGATAPVPRVVKQSRASWRAGGTRAGSIAANATAVVVILVMGFPIYWMVNTSFLRGIDITGPHPTFFPLHGALVNYHKAMNRVFFQALSTSLEVTVMTVLAALTLALLSAVALTRFRFRGRTAFILTVLVVQMVPPVAMIITLFKVLDSWNLINSVFGLTLVYLVFVLPFTIWTLRGFVAGVPLELEEAAMVDGCSRFRAFRSITFPLMAPGLIATGTFAFIQAWNEFLFALVVMNRPQKQTLPVWLQAFNSGAKGTDWGGVMAGSTLISIPVIIFFLIAQTRLTEGLTAGAVKG